MDTKILLESAKVIGLMVLIMSPELMLLLQREQVKKGGIILFSILSKVAIIYFWTGCVAGTLIK